MGEDSGRRRIAIALFAIWAAAAWAPRPHWAADVPRATSRAHRMVQEGHSQDALDLLDAAPADRQPGLDTLLVRGFAGLGVGDPAGAEEAFLSALRIQGEDPQVWLGLCLVSAVRPAAHADPCGRAVALGYLEPGCAPLLARALDNLDHARPTDARVDVETCRAIDPAEPGLALLDPLIDRAESDDAPAAPRRAATSSTAIHLRELTSTLSIPEGRARRRDDKELARIHRLLDREKPKKALRRLDRFSADRPLGLPERLLRAEALRQTGQSEEAAALLETIAPQVAQSGRLLVDGCILASDLTRLAIAEALCTRVDDRFPVRSQATALNALALARLAQGQLAAAEQAFAACLELAPSDAVLWMDASLGAAALGDVEQSLRRLRRALELDPGSVDVEPLRRDEAFAAWRADPRARQALDAIAAGESP